MLGRRSVLLSALALGASLSLGGCGKSESFRYRMTVEVETPQGLRTGSSVFEVEVHEAGGPFELPDASGSRARTRGEAVSVELQDGKVLFALLSKSLLSSGGAAEFPYDALRPSRYQGEYAMIERTRELKGMTGTGILPEADYPILVSFSDISNPESVEEVDPNQLAANFGAGVTLRRITLKITQDPVTNDVSRVLPWLDKYRGFRLDGSDSSYHDVTAKSLSSHLSGGSFSTEFAQ